MPKSTYYNINRSWAPPPTAINRRGKRYEEDQRLETVINSIIVVIRPRRRDDDEEISARNFRSRRTRTWTHALALKTRENIPGFFGGGGGILLTGRRGRPMAPTFCTTYVFQIRNFLEIFFKLQALYFSGVAGEARPKPQQPTQQAVTTADLRTMICSSQTSYRC